MAAAAPAPTPALDERPFRAQVYATMIVNRLAASVRMMRSPMFRAAMPLVLRVS